MGIEITDLSALDPTRVESTQEQLTQMISEDYPEVELRRGVIHDLVMSLHAMLIEGVANTNTDKIRQSMSLSRIVADPTLADDELVDAVISNYNVVRKGLRHDRGPQSPDLRILGGTRHRPGSQR